jgi:hypothetical protein
MDEKNNSKPKETHQTFSVRASIMKELKKDVIPAHKNGIYLEKPDEEEIKARETERMKRMEELKEVEKKLKKTKQVKFLASVVELERIKYYAQITHQTKSEFIRTAIRDKIELLEAQLNKESFEESKNLEKNELSLEELKKIRKALERLEKKL